MSFTLVMAVCVGQIACLPYVSPEPALTKEACELPVETLIDHSESQLGEGDFADLIHNYSWGCFETEQWEMAKQLKVPLPLFCCVLRTQLVRPVGSGLAETCTGRSLTFLWSDKPMRSSDNWVHLKLPAIADIDERIEIAPGKYHIRRQGEILHPERMPRSELEARRNLYPETFAAHYQQAPIPPGGIIIRKDWVRYYDELPPRNSSSVILQSWDAASKLGESNDWSVCTTWLIQDGKYYLMHVLRERLEYPALKARAIEHARAYTPNKILVEDAGIGMGLIQDLQKAGMPAVAVKPERNKKTRMQIQSDKFAAGLMFFPKYASWLAEYEFELFAFPSVRFDDQVDSTSQALAADHSGYNLEVLADGMARLSAGLAFEPIIRSLYHSKFG